MGAPTIETENLTIRPFIIDDVAKVFKLSQEEGMKQWVPDQVYKDEAETEDWRTRPDGPAARLTDGVSGGGCIPPSASRRSARAIRRVLRRGDVVAMHPRR